MVIMQHPPQVRVEVGQSQVVEVGQGRSQLLTHQPVMPTQLH